MRVSCLASAAITLICAAAAGADKAAEAFATAETHLQHGRYQQAYDAYRDFGARFSGDKRASHAQYSAAFILQKKLNRPSEARAAYEKVAATDPTRPLAKSAQYHIAESYEQTGQTDQAIGAYETFLKDAPGNARAPGLQNKLEFLRSKAKGLKADPPGWAHAFGPLKRGGKPNGDDGTHLPPGLQRKALQQNENGPPGKGKGPPTGTEKAPPGKEGKGPPGKGPPGKNGNGPQGLQGRSNGKTDKD